MSTAENLPAVRSGINIPTSLSEVKGYADMFAQSKMFPDIQGAAQAAVKILAGAEMGLPPFQAMRSIHVIKGNTAVAGHTIAARIKAGGRYDYRILEHTPTACRMEFFEHGKKTGEYSYTMDDAKAAGDAGKENYRKYPRAMLFNRCISAGYKIYAPDSLNGAQVYTPDEFDAPIDEDGNAAKAHVVEAEVINTGGAAQVEELKALFTFSLAHLDESRDRAATDKSMRADWKALCNAQSLLSDPSTHTPEQFAGLLAEFRAKVKTAYFGEEIPFEEITTPAPEGVTPLNAAGEQALKAATRPKGRHLDEAITAGTSVLDEEQTKIYAEAAKAALADGKDKADAHDIGLAAAKASTKAAA